METTPMAARWWSIPQAGFCPKAIPWEQPDSANVQNWSGNFEGRQAPGRWKEPGLVSSIILVWEAPVWSAFIKRHEPDLGENPA